MFKVLASGLIYVLLQLAALSDKRVGPSVSDTVLFDQCQPTAVLPNMALTAGKFSKLCKWNNNMLAIGKCEI